jgi:hypothetical protein
MTLVCDVMLLLVAIGSGLVFYVLTLVVWPATGNPVERELIEWMPVWTLTTTALWFLAVDGIKGLRPSRRMPFEYPERIVRQIYRQRLETLWWAIAAHLILLCLCLLLTSQPFISKLFLSLVVALVALAARKGIPDQNMAFAASTGIFSMAMLAITLIHIFSR